MIFGKRAGLYRDLFAHNPQPMFVYALASRRFLEVNDAACAAYGYSRTQFARMTVDDLVAPGERTDPLRPGTAPGEPDLVRHKRSDGSVFYADVIANELLFGTVPAGIAIATDASARIVVSRALSESRAALGEAQELAHLGSFEQDLVTGEMRWSAELFRIFGVDPARERPGLLYEFDHPSDRARVMELAERARLAGDSFTSEHRIVRRTGEERYVFERVRFIHEYGRARRAVGAVLDITDRMYAEQRLRRLAEHDELTGLPNRSLLRARIAEALGCAAATGEYVGLIFLDLDRFKAINDTIAHAAGDEVLCEIAKRVERTIGPDALVGRPGGDEFVILMSRVEGETDAIGTAYELLAAVAEPIDHEGAGLVVTASAGIAIFPRDGATVDEMLRSADSAMYAAKARGGNAVDVFRPSLHVAAVAELTLERALRAALEREGISVAYQPIVDIDCGRVVALEALARWTEDGKAIEPNAFIPLAEATGLIVRLGTYVLNTACRELRRLRDLGFDDLLMCVNISARQFREFDFAGRVRSALETAGIPAQSLQLEITESAYLSADLGARNFGDLEELGVSLSIDDFGTGYSSLGYLKRLPVSAVKIDRSFVADILADPADQAIVRAIIAVAKNLNLEVIAEGVETAEHARYLREQGCTQLQGYYYSRALLPPALEPYLRTPTPVISSEEVHS